MSFINLTSHSIQIFDKENFVNLVETKPGSLVADSVEGEPILSVASSGEARIAMKTELLPSMDGVQMFKTEYSDLIGIPEGISEDDILIVSLATKSNTNASGHPLAKQMVSPYRVVRLTSNTSQILGAIGLTY